MTRARYVDLHILQPIPASNLNRSDTQEPKTIEYGATTRLFHSSQSWKHVIRHALEDDLQEYAARTRMVPVVLADRLHVDGWSQDLAAFAAAEVARCATGKEGGLKTDPAQQGRTQAMLYLPADTTDRLAALCHEHRHALEEAAAKAAEAKSDRTKTAGGKNTSAKTPKAKKSDKDGILPAADIQQLLTRRTATINLFGRMLAEIPDGQVDGAVHMAPAFSVHTADLQPDFFTAVEDWPRPGDRGGAHLQTAFLTTGVLYRYATVNITELLHNLDGDTDQTAHLLGLFTEAFIMELPQGKKTSTAPHTVPDLVHYVIRDRRPVSYSGAFEQPVKARPQGGYTLPARAALTAHARDMDLLVGTRRRVAHGYACTGQDPVTGLGTRHSGFEDLAQACVKAATGNWPTS
ncbi:type I-E CRISPR-associated protein Cas7/Cse4/CasC [Kitasatospora phosalacinea]|uniref:Type I-E CRISPR-associated protein Cas7/Cse4/CasC n=1 Tax=Kitasatospora phosalacinea TaxID=2065 RepID=A0A9W6UNT6_9ACTN|nr:type I-E CRISPR-associated protein Cas7/Cse4/CasC [Kitasatospora phosalacinea]GLW56801.1 type I-E CRISPR-associated protein Cas7/Cse4/CasC [Kitasatospora phosalacinea]